MALVDVKPLQKDVNFGSRISGVTLEALEDPAIRTLIRDVFEQRGVVVFEDVEPSTQMHVGISNVIGPLKEHATRGVPQVDGSLPGVLDLRHDPDDLTIVEIDGRPQTHWIPWHFDHCYNNELNRGAVLRALDVAPEGGLTGFADGIELYNELTPALRRKIEGKKILYSLDLAYSRMRFGKPTNFRVVKESVAMERVVEQSKTQPRAVHPTVWTRKSGEKVLHLSPWMALGIEGDESHEGNELLEAVCQEILAKIRPYYHHWKKTELLVWDNWRMLHSVTGMDLRATRHMQRPTIRGDYGLGYFEGDAKGGAVLEMTV